MNVCQGPGATWKVCCPACKSLRCIAPALRPSGSTPSHSATLPDFDVQYMDEWFGEREADKAAPRWKRWGSPSARRRRVQG